jgi:hypothetical protein
MKLNKARAEWNRLHEFDKRGYLAMFRYGRRTDDISEEEAIRLYCKYRGCICSKDLTLILIIIVLFIIFL